MDISEEDLVLLDEWHVTLYVHAGLPAAAALVLRQRVAVTLDEVVQLMRSARVPHSLRFEIGRN